MLGLFKRKVSEPTIERRVGDGHRIYAIGDIHGRLDLLNDLLARIREDNAGRAGAYTTVIILGDMIDRGPNSAQVIERLMQPLPFARLICLKGNHERVMLEALGGNLDSAAAWLTYGGFEALESWGFSGAELRSSDASDIVAIARNVIPVAAIGWMSGLPITYRNGDYFFVHAGVRPGVALDEQRDEDCLWIREPFLNSRVEHGAMVIHGHSITTGVQMEPNRIGIDTGAYMTGTLTALGLEASARWIVTT